MKPVFLEIGPTGPVITVEFCGTPVQVRQGQNLAAALLSAGFSTLRQTPTSGAPRGPFCMMGACYDCLVVVDGRQVQACQTLTAPGQRITMLEAGFEDVAL